MRWLTLETLLAPGAVTRVAWTPAAPDQAPGCWVHVGGVGFLLEADELRALLATAPKPKTCDPQIAASSPTRPTAPLNRGEARRRPTPRAGAAPADGVGAACSGHAVRAPAAGRVCALPVRTGQQVAAGDLVATLEAMKVEVPVRARAGGVVRAVSAAEGDWVEAGQVLVQLA